MSIDAIDTIYGRFRATSKRRLDIAFDSEHVEVEVFQKAIAAVAADLVVDVGANIGLYAIYSLSAPSVKKVVAVEASTPTYTELSANLAVQSSDKQIESYCVAASAVAGHQSFYEYAPMAGHNALVATSFVGERMGSTVATVATAPLDTLVPDRGRTVAVKIDVEGHELEVLDGAVEFLRGSRGFLQIEIISDENVRAVRERLAGMGYVAVGYVKCDHYFLHESMAALADTLRELMFAEIKLGMVELARLRRQRRSIIRVARRIGEPAAAVVEMVKFRHDPVVVRHVE